MSLIQDKFGNEFLRSNGGMEPGFGPGMLMFSHLPPVTSFTRLASQTVMADLQPHEMILKKERDSPDCGGGGLSAGGMGCGGGIGGMMGSMGDYVHAMGIKQEKVSEHDYRLPLYPGGGVGTGVRSGEELLEVSLGNHQNLVAHDLSLGNVSVPMSFCKKHLDWTVGNYTKEFLTCAFVKRYRTLNLYFTELSYFQYHYILKVKCPLISMEPFHSSKDSLKRSSH